MKKFVTLALALIMALSLAAPALAFTGMEPEAESDSGITLDIKLVDVGQGFFSGSFTVPPTNRGYNQNLVVCAVVSMFVPKGVTPDKDYDKLVFSGKNVSLWQEDNFRAASYGDTAATAFLNAATAEGGGVGMLQHVSNNFAGLVNAAKASAATAASSGIVGYGPFSYAANMGVDNEIILEFAIAYEDDGAAIAAPVAIFPTSPSLDATYQFAIFGKVTADDAEMTATLKGAGALVNALNGASQATTPKIDNTSKLNLIAVKGGDYQVGYFNRGIGGGAASSGGSKPNNAQADAVFSATPATKLITVGTEDIAYVVHNGAAAATAEPLFAIVTDKNFNCKTMYVIDGTGAGAITKVYRVTETKSGYPGAVYVSAWGLYVQFVEEVATGTLLLDPAAAGSPAIVNKLVSIINNDISKFDLDITKSGQMKPDWWAGNKALSASVKVEPWYAEVTVPPEIEIEIPKTGDALSVMGFVLIALAGLAVVAVRKVKA